MPCFAKSSGVALLLNAIHFPSGDHTGPPTPRVTVVTCHGSPPVIGNIKICGASGRPSRSPTRTKASDRPSGDHLGEESRIPLVSRYASSFPEVETAQIDVSYPSFFVLTFTRTKATFDPSGETCGSPTQTKSKRSYSVMFRFCAEIPIERTATTKTKRTTAFRIFAPKETKILVMLGTRRVHTNRPAFISENCSLPSLALQVRRPVSNGRR